MTVGVSGGAEKESIVARGRSGFHYAVLRLRPAAMATTPSHSTKDLKAEMKLMEEGQKQMLKIRWEVLDELKVKGLIRDSVKSK